MGGKFLVMAWEAEQPWDVLRIIVGAFNATALTIQPTVMINVWLCAIYANSGFSVSGNDGILPSRPVNSTGGAADQQATRGRAHSNFDVTDGFVSLGDYWKRVVAKATRRKSAFAEGGQQERTLSLVNKNWGVV